MSGLTKWKIVQRKGPLREIHGPFSRTESEDRTSQGRLESPRFTAFNPDSPKWAGVEERGYQDGWGEKVKSQSGSRPEVSHASPRLRDSKSPHGEWSPAPAGGRTARRRKRHTAVGERQEGENHTRRTAPAPPPQNEGDALRGGGQNPRVPGTHGVAPGFPRL